MIVEHLAAIVGDKAVLREIEALQLYGESASCPCEGEILCVAKPANVEQVVRIVDACRSACVPIVTRGGGTGRAGGAIPTPGERAVIVSLDRMRAIRSIDLVGNVIVAEAGCTLHEVQSAAAEAGRTIGLDHGGAGTSQLGGNLATNAGGNNVLRYGMARDQVLGIEAVLANGAVIGPPRLLHKNNAGYDIRNLLIGSEGTLGIITAASLRLRAPVVATATALLAIETPAEALNLLTLARQHLGEAVSAFELMSRGALEFASSQKPSNASAAEMASPWTVLIECDSTSRFFRIEEAFETLLEDALDSRTVVTGTLASSVAQRRAMWALREGIPEAMGTARVPIVKTDTAVPVEAVPAFICAVEARALAMSPSSRPVFFGHVGDGNIHFNLVAAATADAQAFRALMPDVYRMVEDTALSLGGTVSAEHGIGQTKREALLRMKTAEEIDLMRAVRGAFDPAGILNPHKIIVGSEQAARRRAI